MPEAGPVEERLLIEYRSILTVYVRVLLVWPSRDLCRKVVRGAPEVAGWLLNYSEQQKLSRCFQRFQTEVWGYVPNM